MQVPKPVPKALISLVEHRKPLTPESSSMSFFSFDEATGHGVMQSFLSLQEHGEEAIYAFMVELKSPFIDQLIDHPPYPWLLRFKTAHLTVITNTNQADSVVRLIRIREELKDWLIHSLWALKDPTGSLVSYSNQPEEF